MVKGGMEMESSSLCNIVELLRKPKEPAVGTMRRWDEMGRHVEKDGGGAIIVRGIMVE